MMNQAFIFAEEQKKRINKYIHSIRGNLRVYCRIKPNVIIHLIKKSDWFKYI